MSNQLREAGSIVEKDQPAANVPYEFFRFADEREEIFNFCRATAEYARDNDISGIAYLDRSARPLWIGVREYWKQTYGDQQKAPDMMFINPNGFEPELGRARVEQHTMLNRHADKKLMVVDTCVHSGGTMRDVVGGLEENGFKDVKTAILSSSFKRTRTQPDMAVQKRRPVYGCYPFKYANLVHKGTRVYTNALPKALTDRREAIGVRREIKRIVDECIEAGSPSATAQNDPAYRDGIKIRRLYLAGGALAAMALAEYLDVKDGVSVLENVADAAYMGTLGAVLGRVAGIIITPHR